MAEIDLNRFMGSWFEVARLPNLEADGFGQRGVDVTVTYQKRPDGTISVRTVSYNAKARMRRTEVNGTVRPTNPGQSQLLLTSFRVIRGRLWVVRLDEVPLGADGNAKPTAAVADIAFASAGRSR